ncbi:unnamed protein product, partial [Ectocarpus fasciculatus]
LPRCPWASLQASGLCSQDYSLWILGNARPPRKSLCLAGCPPPPPRRRPRVRRAAGGQVLRIPYLPGPVPSRPPTAKLVHHY